MRFIYFSCTIATRDLIEKNVKYVQNSAIFMNKSSFFIVGKHAVIEALKSPRRKVLRIFLTEESKKNIIKNKENLTLACLDNVNDPRNIGSLIRSAASFNVDGIIVKDRHFPNESKLMYKAASGCIEHINVFEVTNINSTLKNLREKNFWIYGFDSKGDKNFTEIKWEGNNILLFGSEGYGVKKHTSKYTDFLVKIDINKNIESLNVSNSAAIVFHHLSVLKNN